MKIATKYMDYSKVITCEEHSVIGGRYGLCAANIVATAKEMCK